MSSFVQRTTLLEKILIMIDQLGHIITGIISLLIVGDVCGSLLLLLLPLQLDEGLPERTLSGVGLSRRRVLLQNDGLHDGIGHAGGVGRLSVAPSTASWIGDGSKVAKLIRTRCLLANRGVGLAT